MKDFLSIAAGVVFCLGFVPYIWGILKPKVGWRRLNALISWLDSRSPTPVKPVRVTWFIWTVLDVLLLVGMHSAGATNGQIIAAVFCGLMVFVLSLKYGKHGWGWVDIGCLVGAIIGIALWQVYQDVFWGIVIFLVIGSFGAVPTFWSAWKDPSREDRLAWMIWWVSCVLTIVAIPQWTLADAGQPLLFFVVESVMVLILLIRPHI